MKRAEIVAAVGGVLFSAAFVACSSDPTSAPVTPTPTPPADDASVTPAPTGTLTLLVADSAKTGLSHTPTPLANANVALYPPGDGPVMEKTTGPDGTVTFTGIDWSLGTAQVISYAEGYTAQVATEVSPDNLSNAEKYFDYDGLVIPLPARAAANALTLVKGQLLNKTAATNYVILAATNTNGTYYQDATSSYQLFVKNTEPFTLVAAEFAAGKAPIVQTFSHWVKVDATANATAVDIDFSTATPFTTKQVSFTYKMPDFTRTSAITTFTPYTIVTLQKATNAPLGYLTSYEIATDRMTATSNVELTSDIPGDELVYHQIRAASGATTFVIDEGAPTPGATIEGFLPPPVFASAQMGLTDTLALTGVVAGENLQVQMLSSTGDVVFYRSSLAKTTDGSFTLPALKGIPDALKAQIGTSAAYAYVVVSLKNDLLPISQISHHYAYGAPITVK